MITLEDLKHGAKFNMLMALDMAHGAYHNQYVSATYPRFTVVKTGSPHSPKVEQLHTTTYYVDEIECKNLTDVLAMLNAAPHPNRTGLARHQDEGN
jgi:hypothetical protein